MYLWAELDDMESLSHGYVLGTRSCLWDLFFGREGHWTLRISWDLIEGEGSVKFLEQQ